MTNDSSGLSVTPHSLASRFLGTREVAGATSNPAILAMLRLDAAWVEDDRTPWCSAFVGAIAWLLGLERSGSLAARSWLTVGCAVEPADGASVGFDIVILQRGAGEQPGPEVLRAPGHVGFFSGWDGEQRVLVLGGNQGDSVSVASFPRARILGIRSIAPPF